MDLKLHWHDVTENIRQGRQPVVMIERPQVGAPGRSKHGDVFSVASVGRFGEFWVPEAPVLDEDPQWTITVQGDYVRVPMHAYRTTQLAKGAIFATGVELGMRAIASLGLKCPKLPEEVTLILGNDVHAIDGEDGVRVYRCYLGIAIRI